MELGVVLAPAVAPDLHIHLHTSISAESAEWGAGPASEHRATPWCLPLTETRTRLLERSSMQLPGGLRCVACVVAPSARLDRR